MLTLDRSPADDYHQPRAGQAVQVLRAAAELRSTDAVVEGYVAALRGQVAVLTAPYDPDTKTVQFPAALPASYTNPKQTAQLYLRVWEEQLTGNTTGTPITLTGTGSRSPSASTAPDPCTPTTTGASASGPAPPPRSTPDGTCAPPSRPTARGSGPARSR